MKLGSAIGMQIFTEVCLAIGLMGALGFFILMIMDYSVSLGLLSAFTVLVWLYYLALVRAESTENTVRKIIIHLNKGR